MSPQCMQQDQLTKKYMKFSHIQRILSQHSRVEYSVRDGIQNSEFLLPLVTVHYCEIYNVVKCKNAHTVRSTVLK